MGAKHVRTLEATYNYALTLKYLGRTEEAALLQKEVLDEFTKSLGGRHENTLFLESNYGATLKELGRLDEAETIQ